jgi:hypothetical protein
MKSLLQMYFAVSLTNRLLNILQIPTFPLGKGDAGDHFFRYLHTHGGVEAMPNTTRK